MAEIKELRPFLDGCGNTIIVEDPSTLVCPTVRVRFRGSGNLLVIKSGAQLHRFVGDFLGDGATCVIGSNSDADSGNWEILLGTSAEVTIADSVVASGPVTVNVGTHAKVSIGKGSSFGKNCRLDAILEVEMLYGTTGTPMEREPDITIGERVSLADDVLCFPGIEIGQQARVETKAVVMNDLPPHCRAAGSPAHVVEAEVQWRLVDPYSPLTQPGI